MPAAPRTPEEPSAEMALVAQARQGDLDACNQFCRDYYPGVYRFLLWLTERPEVAEDLTQETFVRAWRALGTFDGRAPLRVWLHRIAHREFLRSLRRQRSQVPLDALIDLAAPATDPAEAAALWQAIRKLPVEEGEIVVLHYLQGYTCQEIAQIVRAPLTTVKYRLAAARAHLERELGEGDLIYLNQWAPSEHRWSWLPLEQMRDLEARLSSSTSQGWDGSPARPSHPGPRPEDPTMASDKLSRRDLLATAAGAGAAALTGRSDANIVDSRLTRKVTAAFKGTALADVCERLRTETGVHLAAGPSVADEKVTLFCKATPLREVMRQLSRPFGYTWTRSGRENRYRYELVQDLRSQLLEEELRTRDRNAALIALDREMERYRAHRDLSPDEALSRVDSAPPEEKQQLDRLSDYRWAAIQLYFRLSPADLSSLRDGRHLSFRAEPGPGDQPLPQDLARGLLESRRGKRIRRLDSGFQWEDEKDLPDGLRPSEVPEARPSNIGFWMEQKELGHFVLWGGIDIKVGDATDGAFSPLAEGRCPGTLHPDNRRANAALARDRSLRGKVSVHLSLTPTPNRGGESGSTGDNKNVQHPLSASESKPEGKVSEKATSADVLEALHLATGIPIVADFYTHLYDRKTVSVHDEPLFDALNRLSDAMRLRWHKDEDWIEFRSASYYDDRLKEVPNRLLQRWSEARKRQQILALDDMVEIAQLTDAQLDAEHMAEGARELWNLPEWDVARHRNLRPHFRFLATFSPEQSRTAASPSDISFAQLTLAQQNQLASLAFVHRGGGVSYNTLGPLGSLTELSELGLRVEYTQPDWFHWWPRDKAPKKGDPPFHPPTVRERTREAALAAARRLDPNATDAQIVPTEREVTFIYTGRRGSTLNVHWARIHGNWSDELPVE